MQFGEKLAEVVAASVPCCVGIDPHLDRIPHGVGVGEWAIGVLEALHGVRSCSPEPG